VLEHMDTCGGRIEEGGKKSGGRLAAEDNKGPKSHGRQYLLVVGDTTPKPTRGAERRKKACMVERTKRKILKTATLDDVHLLGEYRVLTDSERGVRGTEVVSVARRDTGKEKGSDGGQRRSSERWPASALNHRAKKREKFGAGRGLKRLYRSRLGERGS